MEGEIREMKKSIENNDFYDTTNLCIGQAFHHLLHEILLGNPLNRNKQIIITPVTFPENEEN